MSPVDTEKHEGPSARTVSALVDDAAERLAAVGIESPREDAEAIVADALGVKPEELSVDSADDVSPDIAAAIEAKVKKRVEREPLAYVLGRAPFRDLEIAVDPRVLWPRRETELLVEVGTKLPQGARVHEVGTGSGAIALALMSERPDLKITASDLSPEAVEAARENADRLGLDFDVRVAKGIPDDIGDGLRINLFIQEERLLNRLVGDPSVQVILLFVRASVLDLFENLKRHFDRALLSLMG